MFKKVCLVLIICMFGGVSAEESRERLIVLLEQMTSLSSEFEQRTYKEASANVDVSSGKFTLQKPMKFNWTVTKPYEQQVISDGETLWVFDPDLEQATYQKISENIQQSPAMILVQPRLSLDERYQVYEAERETFSVFKLIPSKEEGVFAELSLVFEEGVISEIRILDTLGQETLVQFSNVEVDVNLDNSLFEFNPPPGTDLFEQM
jgi:outer membrane lipoprotein carrier protein